MNLRKALFALLLGLLNFAGTCVDVPYSNEPQGDARGSGTGGDADKDKNHFATLSGWVNLGSPIKLAQVRLHRFENAEMGEKLAEEMTDDKGKFSLAIPKQPPGPCVVVVEGGRYDDPTTGEVIHLQSHQVRAPMAVVKAGPQDVSVNFWTTLAVARLQATKSHYDSLDKAISANLLLMSQHLYRQADADAITKTKPIDVFVRGVKLEDFNLRAHLSQLGLSRLANHHYHIATLELLERLSAELAKGVFKDSEATRSHLVVYLNEALLELKKQGELGFNPAGFDGAGGFYSDLASDTSQSLYSVGTIPNPNPLELPFLYHVKVVDASTLAAFAPIIATAQLKFPQQVSKVDVKLIQIKKPAECRQIWQRKALAAGAPIERLPKCKYLTEKTEQKTLQSTTENVTQGGELLVSFAGQAEDLTGEIFYQVQFEVHHVNGARIPFETAKFRPLVSQEQVFGGKTTRTVDMYADPLRRAGDWYKEHREARKVGALEWELGYSEETMEFEEARAYAEIRQANDWRLPTIWELDVFYQQKSVLGDDLDAKDYFWSDTVVTGKDDYWVLWFRTGIVNGLKGWHRVRLCRNPRD